MAKITAQVIYQCGCEGSETAQAPSRQADYQTKRMQNYAATRLCHDCYKAEKQAERNAAATLTADWPVIENKVAVQIRDGWVAYLNENGERLQGEFGATDEQWQAMMNGLPRMTASEWKSVPLRSYMDEEVDKVIEIAFGKA